MTIAPRFTAITLGVDDVRRSAEFYERLGFVRKMRRTGDEVAFFETGATALALYSWRKTAQEAGVPHDPRPAAFRGCTLAWNCASSAEVDAVIAHALAAGARQIKPAQPTNYGGYAGYFADPDGHVWEAVTAPGILVRPDGRVTLPD